jgi:hypothetical protein
MPGHYTKDDCRNADHDNGFMAPPHKGECPKYTYYAGGERQEWHDYNEPGGCHYGTNDGSSQNSGSSGCHYGTSDGSSDGTSDGTSGGRMPLRYQ